MKKYAFYIIGVFSGFINGFLGTGGGTVVVPSIEWVGTDTKKSHATAIAIILPITLVSAFFYLRQGNVDIKSTLILSASGCAGAFLGAKFLKKIPPSYLKIAFGISMIVGGIKSFIS